MQLESQSPFLLFFDMSEIYSGCKFWWFCLAPFCYMTNYNMKQNEIRSKTKEYRKGQGNADKGLTDSNWGNQVTILRRGDI